MALNTLRLRRLTTPGLYGDGGNLWLKVSSPENRSWVFRYMIAGKARSMGLGSVDDLSLAEAREKADAARKLVRAGTDPLEARNAERVAAITANARAVTFGEAAKRYIAAQQAGWCAKHHKNWRFSLDNDVLPMIGQLPVEKIDTALILKALERIWPTKPETASRIRRRIEAVLSYAIARGWRDSPNPAVWRGHLQLMLPPKNKVQPLQHFAALDWREASAVMVELRKQAHIGARALQFAILTAARSGEVRGATWDEIDFEHAVWQIPAARMKAAKPHRVPLSKPALAILQSMVLLRAEGGLVFPGRSLRQPLNSETVIDALRRMGRDDVTVHGFRSTFRDWAAEATGYPNHVVEQALAHTISSAVEAAYRRGDLFEKRRVLMNDWAEYLARPPADVVPLRTRRSKSAVQGQIEA